MCFLPTTLFQRLSPLIPFEVRLHTVCQDVDWEERLCVCDLDSMHTTYITLQINERANE